MLSSSLQCDRLDIDIFSRIVQAVRDNGYFVANDIFTLQQLNSLFDDLTDIDNNKFHQAGIGRELQEHTNNAIRRDEIYWLERSRKAMSFYWSWIEQLRIRINSELFLGLFEYECHYAQYSKGAFYKKHVDAFQGFENRKLSTVLYLNPIWHEDDGGELIMYDEKDDNVIMSVSPHLGTLVVFLSEVFPHEVRVAHRTRYSLTGWFRINNTTSLNLDPPR